MDVELLDQIDRLVDGLCPCGAQPRDGSAYCSDDCTPTHISVHTDQRETGDYATPMRWRPDLVTAVDDTDLRDLGSNTFYDGPFHAQLFQRGEPVDGAATWHLRLDDGCRFVGADLPGVRVIDDELRQRVAEKWAALERELGNSQHVEADPWADVMRAVEATMFGPAWQSIQAGQIVTADMFVPLARIDNTTMSAADIRAFWPGVSEPALGAAFVTPRTRAELSAAVEHAEPHDPAAWPRLVHHRTPLARRLLVSQRLCRDCGQHGVPGPAAGDLSRPRCPHCAATYPGPQTTLTVRHDFQTDRYRLTVAVDGFSAEEVVTVEQAECRRNIQTAYDIAEGSVLADLGLAERTAPLTPTWMGETAHSTMARLGFHWLWALPPTVDPRAFRITNIY